MIASGTAALSYLLVTLAVLRALHWLSTADRSLQRAQAALDDSEMRYRALTDAMPQLIWIVDAAGQLEYVNERWSKYTGFALDRGRPCELASIVHPADRAQLALPEHAADDGAVECEVRLHRNEGTFCWHLVRSVPFGSDAARVTKRIVTATDIDARKLAEAALATSTAEHIHRANHDPLTGLPNRAHVVERLAQMIAQAERDGTNVVVLSLDIDYFKTINDTLGHAAGDRLLIETAERIKASLRDEDALSRMGGDEFIIVCAADGVVDAAAIAGRLQATVRAPLELDGKPVAISSSVGISIYPVDAATPADLVQKADAALYLAKQGGRDAWSFYSAQTSPPSVPKLDLELELRAAIAQEQFVVYYQPIIDIATGRAIGAEALVRWQHPQRGLLLPAEFIAFAEDHGMIAPIGDIVLNAACAQLVRMRLEPDDDFSIAVNVSGRQFARPSFVGAIASTIAAHGIEARRLEIEITESVVMTDIAAVSGTLERLERLGVRLSIDDFGTGYCSLAYLKNFPIDTLKIDRSFVSDIAQNVTDQAIAKAIVTLAHSLGMRTIAEGVETQAQLERLAAIGADSLQGYLIARPLPAAAFEAFYLSRCDHAPGDAAVVPS